MSLVISEISDEIQKHMDICEDILIREANGEGFELDITQSHNINDSTPDQRKYLESHYQDDIDDGINKLSDYFENNPDLQVVDQNDLSEIIYQTLGCLLVKPVRSVDQYNSGIYVYFVNIVDNIHLKSRIEVQFMDNMQLNNISYKNVDLEIEKLKLFQLVGKVVSRYNK